MIAKITRGKNPGDIGAYLHGPGKANEHTYTVAGQRVSGGVVVGSNRGLGKIYPEIHAKESAAC